MKRLSSSVVGIDRGSVQLFSHFEEGGPMWTAQGPRYIRRSVRFSEPFREPPTVIVVPEMWDIDQASNQRADLSVENVTCEGCDVVFRTWGDTRVARIRAGWTAIGPVGHEDDWDVDAP